MSRFKTELCNNLIELGSCKYGDRCHYAHGVHELRQVSKRHPKYRTEKCKNFELTGKCPFGPRCSYVHPKPDLDSMIEQLTKYMKHTRAPKPEPEELEGVEENVNPFVTTSNASTSSDNSIIRLNDENKENYEQLGFDYNHFQSTGSNNLLQQQLSLSFIKNSIDQQRSGQQISPSSSPAQAFNNEDNTISSQAPTLSSSILRTPLRNSNSCNILTPINSSINRYSPNNQTIIRSQLAINDSFDSKVTTCEATSNASQNKLDLMSSDPPCNPASYLFGTNNPRSILSNSNLNDRSPLQPRKQFYTRF